MDINYFSKQFILYANDERVINAKDERALAIKVSGEKEILQFCMNDLNTVRPEVFVHLMKEVAKEKGYAEAIRMNQPSEITHFCLRFQDELKEKVLYEMSDARNDR